MKLIVDVEAFEKYLDLYIDPYEIPGAMEALREASENDMGVTNEKKDQTIKSIKIVRCKECKHWHEGEWYNTCDKNIGHGYEADFFCSYGERRGK